MEVRNKARRNFMKFGAGAALAAVNAGKAAAQRPAIRPGAITRTGWKNDAHRASGNGPIDNTTSQIVKYVASFSESDLTPALVGAIGDTLVDSMASLIAGFESEAVRIAARMSRTIRSDLQCTVLGYGITTSPEMAAFTNGCMLRQADYNDLGPGGHVSDIISGILAVGEAFHSTGTEMLAAIALGYEIAGALAAAGANSAGGGGWDGR